MNIYVEPTVRILVAFVLTIIFLLILKKILNYSTDNGDSGSGQIFWIELVLAIYMTLMPISQAYIHNSFAQYKNKTITQSETLMTQYGIVQEDGTVKFHDVEWVEEDGKTNLIIKDMTPEEWKSIH